MDVSMPVMDRVEATAEVRRLDKMPRPHIVALTAFASESQRKKCLDAGMDEFISKPLTKEDLYILFRRLRLLEWSL